ncbi:ferritin-like domain-containing protein [Arthrobacter sp. NPDC058288]|uniref:ferritin-like domain-containing protein n=1 Tax=Arthrobacter sp. NPDC058288 TaxID=3346424 RepID=UPI0036ECCA2C
MKDDTKEKRRPGRYFRYGILASLAVLVISLGLALTPGQPPEAPEPPFSEQARAAALAETMQLRTAGSKLADSVSGAERQALLRAVTLLTTQARALSGPGQKPSPSATDATSGSASGAASATASGTAAVSASPPVSGEPSGPDSPTGLVASLSASGSQRLRDAEASDGGIARLLAAVGTAQVLQASSLATGLGATAPELPALPAPSPETAAPPAAAAAAPQPGASPSAASPVPGSMAAASPGGSPPAVESSCRPDPAASGPAAGAATPATALAMAVKTEAETVYGYQVALARLEGAPAGLASQLLARHESVLAEAEALSRAQCADIPPREAGYTLGPLFLESPAAGLGSLEAGTLPVYGDLVALSDGSTRQWAIAGLLAAASRAAQWGADSGPLPGIVVDTARLPQLAPDSPATESGAPEASPEPSDAG